MLRIVEDFQDYPSNIKLAIITTTIAWVWFYIPLALIYNLSDNTSISFREVMIGVCMLLLLSSMKRWARVLCLLCNVMAGLFTITIAIGLSQMKLIAVLLWIDVVLLLISSFWLAIKPTSEFYMQYNTKPTDEDMPNESR